MVGDSLAEVVPACKVRGEQAAGTEAAVQAAVRVIASQGEVQAAGSLGASGHDDAAIGLDDDSVAEVIIVVVAGHEVGDDNALVSEGAIQGAVRAETSQAHDAPRI